LSQNVASPSWATALAKLSPGGRAWMQGTAVADGTACAIRTVTVCARQVGEKTSKSWSGVSR
jgi:hypothetical protein